VRIQNYACGPSAVTRDCTNNTSVRSASRSATYASVRARMATSIAGRARSMGSSSTRTSSRRRRFSRLRSTAECWWRGTTIPILGNARGEARTRTSRCAVRIRFPSRMTACMSRLRVSRLRRGKPKPVLDACVLARKLNGQAPTTLFTTTAEDCASPLGFHARAKAVRGNAALVPGTIGGLTHGRLQKRCERTCGADR
jgi:hypothetical protein